MSDQPMNEEFRVDTAEKAAQIMRKYRALAQRFDQNARLADAEHDRIIAWLEKAQAPIAARMEYYEEHLRAYAMMLRAEGQKSVTLPDGDIKTRVTGPTFEVDKAAFVEWAQEQKRDDVLRVSVAPDMSAIKSTFVADASTAVDPASGEIVPGLTPVPERITVTLAPDLDAAPECDEEFDDE